MILALFAVNEEDRARTPEGRGEPGRAAGGLHGGVPAPQPPGVVNGSLLVFVICLGFFVARSYLGTPRDMMISQLINQQIEELLARDSPPRWR
jgi:putative spermidine/putrescine transport system permease protein